MDGWLLFPFPEKSNNTLIASFLLTFFSFPYYILMYVIICHLQGQYEQLVWCRNRPIRVDAGDPSLLQQMLF